MIAILEAISDSVSALPVVGSPAPLGSGVPEPGGFAATLAAAQGVSVPSPIAPSGAEISGESAAGNSGTAVGLNVRVPAGNAPAKKLPGGNPPLAGNTWAGTTTVFAGIVPAMANQISLPAQPNIVQTSVLAQSPISNGVSGINQSPGVQQTRSQQLGTQVLGSRTSAYENAAKNASLSYFTGYSATSPAAGTSGALANPDRTAGVQTSGQANGQEAGAANVAESPILSATAGETVSDGGTGSPSAVPGNQWNAESSFVAPAENTQPSVHSSSAPSSIAASSPQFASRTAVRETAPGSVGNDSEVVPAPAENTLLTENTPPSALSTANAQPLSTASWQDTVPATPSRGSTVEGIGNGIGEPFAQAAQTIPTLLASANSAAGVAARVLSSSGGDISISQDNSSSAIASAEDQIDPAAQTGAGNEPSGILNGAGAALLGLNSAVQLAAGRTAPRIAAPRATAVITPGVRTSGATASASTLAASSATEAANGSAAASQTPFSIFFSSPGPGTESAASTLPKMILPAASSSIRDSHAVDTSTESAPSGGVSKSNATQNAASPNSGGSTAGQSTSSSTAPALHVDPAAAPVAAVPTAAAPSPAAPGSAGATPPLVQQPATADPLPKPGTTTGTAGNQAMPLPVASEPASAAATGPVQMAQMVSRVGQAEMRIGVNTSAFGSVEVRTVVHANDVGLTIGSEKGDLRGLLNNEMPAITNGLQQQNLRLSSVNFTQGFASSGNGSGGGDSQQRSFVPTTASSSSGSISSENAGENLADLPPLGIFSGVSGSLSILA